jgi:hypothetical protein
MSLEGSAKQLSMLSFLSGFPLPELLKKRSLELRMAPADDVAQKIIGEKRIPVLCKKGEPLPSRLVTMESNAVQIHFDLLGTIFYILIRAEEMLNPIRDEHGRFPAAASHAYREGYLHRPVVDELVEILWGCMKHLWPGLERQSREFRMKVTHDVDVPFNIAFIPPRQILRSMGGDVIKRKNPKQAFLRGLNWASVKLGNNAQDPCYTFDFIMDVAEKDGLQDDFYFIPKNTHSFDGVYDLEHPRIRKLMKYISRRGHKIGYHGSYMTYQDPGKTKEEVAHLKKVARSLGIEQEEWGGRQHYLRWEAPTTWRNYAEAGLHYDTSLSYADYAGFRCGTCHPFPVFDLEQNRELSLMEYPLIVMECSVLGEKYMGLPPDEAYDYMVQLKNTCRKYGGCFTLLWHNSYFAGDEEKRLYQEIVAQ